jgi:hypothetical protein
MFPRFICEAKEGEEQKCAKDQGPATEFVCDELDSVASP